MPATHRVTVYRNNGTAETYRITAETHFSASLAIDGLECRPGTIEVVDLWEDDGRVIVTRRGKTVPTSERAPGRTPGSPANCGNDHASRTARLAALRVADMEAGPRGVGPGAELAAALADDVRRTAGPAVAGALTAFAAEFCDPTTIRQGSRVLSGGEVTAVAGLLRAAGHPAAADAWDAAYSKHDEPGD